MGEGADHRTQATLYFIDTAVLWKLRLSSGRPAARGSRGFVRKTRDKMAAGVIRGRRARGDAIGGGFENVRSARGAFGVRRA